MNYFKKKTLLALLKRGIIFFFISTLSVVIIYRFVNPPVTPLMLIRYVGCLGEGKKANLKKYWVSLEKISMNMPKAVMASEDQRFLEHHGFDFEAIEKAFDSNARKKNKKHIKGGSTISQQVAKNIFLWPGRSWLRKGLETYFTILIEICWSKYRIMEVYLNVIEMGEGIYGAETATQSYFHTTALKLNTNQAAILAAILPNPRKWSVLKPTSYITARQTWIRRNMNYIKIKFD